MNTIEIMKAAVYTAEDYPCQNRGGQNTNGPVLGCRVTHPQFNISVFFGENRSYRENREAAEAMFLLALHMITSKTNNDGNNQGGSDQISS